jgi:hypothetical protein
MNNSMMNMAWDPVQIAHAVQAAQSLLHGQN